MYHGHKATAFTPSFEKMSFWEKLLVRAIAPNLAMEYPDSPTFLNPRLGQSPAIEAIFTIRPPIFFIDCNF